MRAVRLDLPWTFPAVRLYLHDAFQDIVSDCINEDRQWEIDRTVILMKYLDRGWNVVDVGANIGYYTLLFSRCVGRSGHVTAVEPDPANLKVLRANVARNRPCNIEVIDAALCDVSGQGQLYRSRGNLGDHRLAPQQDRESCPVRLAAGDDVLSHAGSPIHLVKMDVQGAEARALCGMHRLLRRNAAHLAMLVEFSPLLLQQSGTAPGDFFRLVRELGGRVLRFGQDGRGGIGIWTADDSELARLTDDLVAREIEDIGEDLILFFSLEAEARFRQRLDAPWPGLLTGLWRWSGFA
jgi:FkbM family methyltransferase